MSNGEQLLADYAKTGSEAAFRELVERYINLVYSAAFRLVNNDAHLAEDVSQTVFADLARMAPRLSADVMLGGWLHRHTCYVASNILRRERRRQHREQQAVQMNSMEDHSEENLAMIAPILDDAIDQLGSDDRAAILLRYFEQKDFRSVGEALGSNEEAARKRVNRALDKLHALLTRRGVALSATALAGVLSAKAVSAAPVGLAVNISATALASAATGGGAAITFLKIMSMTKMQIGIATAVVAAIAIPLVMEYQNNQTLRAENKTLRERVTQFDQLTAENKRLNGLIAETQAANRATTSATSTNPEHHELMKLRGEVGRLQTAASAPKASPISSVISDPTMRKAIRNQQKIGMKYMYSDFIKNSKLSKEQNEKFVDLLADDVMENVDKIGQLLQESKSRDEINDAFTAQEAALKAKVKTLLGDDALAKFEDFTHNLANRMTVEAFKQEMTGDKAAKEAKAKQLMTALQEERQTALADAGLPADYQTMLILNFRNIASADEEERNLAMLDKVFTRVGNRAESFLSADELKKWSDLRTNAIAQNRMVLGMNRKMMAPAGK